MAPFPVRQFGQLLGYRNVQVDIDEDVLTAVAAKTGGKYFRADSTDTLQKIYDEIDRLEKSEVEVKKYVNVKELFPWVLVPGIFLLLLGIVLDQTVWRRLP